MLLKPKKKQRCAKCGSIKPVSCFTKLINKSKLGLQLYYCYCKKCAAIYCKEARSKYTEEKKLKIAEKNKVSLRKRIKANPEKMREQYKRNFNDWIERPGNRKLHNERRAKAKANKQRSK